MQFMRGKILYRFPSNNPELPKKWVIATKRDNWTPSKSAVLCEKHFKPSDYFCNDIELPSNLCVKRKRLKPDAVPSIFDFPEHLLPKCNARKPPRIRLTSEKEPACIPKAPAIKNSFLNTPMQHHKLKRLRN